MAKVYILSYDTDSGNKEDWNPFYIPFEAFHTPEDRQRRVDFLKSLDGHLEFLEKDLDPMGPDQIEAVSEELKDMFDIEDDEGE